MALLNKLMLKHDLGTADFTLKADEGESFLVKDILFADSGAEFSEILVDRMSILALTTLNAQLNQNPFHFADIDRPGIIKILSDAGLWKGIPVASGQTLTVKTNYDGAKRCMVLYERYDQDDIKSDMENGTKGKEYLYINYGSNAIAFADAAYGAFDNSILPAEYMNFPFGDVVPSGYEVDLLAVMTNRKDRTGAVNLGLPWTKLTRSREVLFDSDREGIFTGSGQSLWGWGGREYADQQPITLLPETITFKAGDELLVQQYNDSGGELAIGYCIIGVALKVRRAE